MTAPLPRATVFPNKIDLTATESATHQEQIKVGIPPSGVIPKIDVYFVSDNTGSMTAIINAVKNGANEIVTKLHEKAKDITADMAFGVGSYTDFSAAGTTFNHQLSPTKDIVEVEKALRNWTTVGNTTTAEAQLYALDQIAEAPGGRIGWRSEAKRIIVWLGDAPGHDPIPPEISKLGYEISEESVTKKLKQQRIFVLAISTPNLGNSSSPGLDADPVSYGNTNGGSPYTVFRGRPGQGTRIASETEGQFADKINADSVVAKIIELGGAEVSKISKVKLIPDAQIKPFLSSINPTTGHGPLIGGQQHDVDFDVLFSSVSTSGKPAETKPETVEGLLKVEADGIPVGQTSVVITVPDLSGIYRIQSTKSKKYLQLESPGWNSDPDNDGSNIAQGSYTDEKYQQWELVPVPGGGYLIKSVYPPVARYLEVPWDWRENGTNILTRKDSNGDNKQWRLIPTGSYEEGVIYAIQNIASGKALDVPGGSADDGTRIDQWDYWGNWPEWHQEHNQHWRLLRV